MTDVMNNAKVKINLRSMKKSLLYSILTVFIIFSLLNAWQTFYGSLKPTVKKFITSFDECAAAGYPILESYPERCITPQGQSFTQDIGNELVKADLIRVNSPRPNQAVASPLIITGQARGTWFFEASFPIKLLAHDGQIIASGIAQAQTNWMTENFVPFTAELNFYNPATTRGNLILMKDNPSGLPQNDDALRIPVIFSGENQAGQQTVKIYFSNSQLDPNTDCQTVFPITRTIPKTTAVAKATLEQLLQGPTDTEKQQGYLTSINDEVKIQKLTIINGVAKVDFNDQLEYWVGGSCRVSAIRTQIIQTLKQFPTVKEVIISINDRTKDILQP